MWFWNVIFWRFIIFKNCPLEQFCIYIECPFEELSFWTIVFLKKCPFLEVSFWQLFLLQTLSRGNHCAKSWDMHAIHENRTNSCAIHGVSLWTINSSFTEFVLLKNYCPFEECSFEDIFIWIIVLWRTVLLNISSFTEIVLLDNYCPF